MTGDFPSFVSSVTRSDDNCSISVLCKEVFADRCCGYSIEHGKSEVRKHDGQYEYVADIYISIRTNCWALLEVNISKSGNPALYKPDVQKRVYANFEPFDYEDNSRAILSRIRLRGTIPIDTQDGGDGDESSSKSTENSEESNDDSVTPTTDKRNAYEDHMEETEEINRPPMKTSVGEIDEELEKGS